MIELVYAYLEEEGHERFVSTNDSRTAMQLLNEERPDLLLLDLNMPHVHGFDILTNLRACEQFQFLPVIILTSATDAEHKLQALDLGATDFLAKPVDPSELKLRVRNNLAAKAFQDQLAYYDKLTGLPNKLFFLDRLAWSLQGCQRSKTQLAVISINLNQVSKVNDTQGNHARDEVLRQTASLLQGALRQSDALTHSSLPESRDLSHFGGEEFSVIALGIEDESGLVAIANRINGLFEEPMAVFGQEVYIGVSIGVAMSGQDGMNADNLLSNAEHAAREAKKKQIRPCHFFAEESVQKAKKRLYLESELRHAVARDQLELFYQPKFHAKTLQLSGAEALVRWRHPELGLVPPFEFIPLAEEAKLIVGIGDWVLHEACRQNVEWNKLGFRRHKISVNVSAQQLELSDFCQTIAEALTVSQLPADKLIIELTESMSMDRSVDHLGIIKNMKETGVSISIDDFGTGYSSLSYLNKLPVDELKIDKSFVDDMASNPAIIKAIVAMGHSLGFSIVAEGIEEKAQLKFLRAISCDLLQGYLFSRPLPAAEYQDFLFSLRKKSKQ
jgi:diguanylate cyclase (GGDEF)-like protein